MVQMTDLQEIDGIGPSYAEELEANGFDDAEAVAEADPDDIDEMLDSLDGHQVVEAATAEVESDEDDEDDDTGVYEIEPDFDEDQRNHLIRALVTQEVQARRRNDSSRAEAIRDAIGQVIEGEPYEMTMEQLDAAYTGANQLESEYRGTRGLGSFTTKIRGIRNTFKDARQEHWD
jgi:hypothetical protein